VNPVDVTAQLFNRDEHAFLDVCSTVIECEQVDQLAVILTMVTGAMGERLALDLVGLAHSTTKPVHVVWLAGRDQTDDGRQVFRSAGLAVHDSVGQMARVARTLVDVGDVPASYPEELSLIDAGSVPSLLRGREVLEADAASFLDAIGVARPRGGIARTATDAVALAQEIGEPVAIKVQASGLVHKTEAGGVYLGVVLADVAQVWTKLRSRWDDGAELLLQEMVQPGLELVVGVIASPSGLPSIVSVGLGGVATELYGDLVSRPAPVGPLEARRMLSELGAAPLLTGFRGSPPVDIDAAADAIARVSAAAASLGSRLVEMEINPLIVGPVGAGAVAADFLARLAVGSDLGDTCHG
jgi:acyl-CoA synthetase (NDP forming)